MKFIIWSKDGCIWCKRAKEFLEDHGIEHEIVMFETPDEIRNFKDLGFRSFPQVFEVTENGKQYLIGGHDSLVNYVTDGSLWD